MSNGECQDGDPHTSDKPMVGVARGLDLYACDKCHRVFGVRP